MATCEYEAFLAEGYRFGIFIQDDYFRFECTLYDTTSIVRVQRVGAFSTIFTSNLQEVYET